MSVPSRLAPGDDTVGPWLIADSAPIDPRLLVWLIGGSALIAVLVAIISTRLWTKRYAIPMILNEFKEKYADVEAALNTADAAISSGMTALSQKGVETREIKRMEKAIFSELLDQYPEVKLAIETFSPETAESLKENPQQAAIMLERYLPLAEKLFPKLFQQRDKSEESKYDF